MLSSRSNHRPISPNPDLQLSPNSADDSVRAFPFPTPFSLIQPPSYRPPLPRHIPPTLGMQIHPSTPGPSARHRRINARGDPTNRQGSAEAVAAAGLKAKMREPLEATKVTSSISKSTSGLARRVSGALVIRDVVMCLRGEARNACSWMTLRSTG